MNQHSDVRQFPGHAVIGDNYRYNYQTIKDNVSLLKPKLLEEVNQLVVESGHKIAGKLLIHNVLPKKGYLGKAERDREQGETFAAMRRQHPAVEPAINDLEQRGLDRVRAKGSDGFAHTVALAVVALNMHRIGRLVRDNAPREKTRKRHRHAA